MENIRLTPVLISTEDASFLSLYNDILSECSFDGKPRKAHQGKNHHLYLCSTLPIKKGDWVYIKNSNSIRKVAFNDTKDPQNWIVVGENNAILKSAAQKIELTTDLKIIADGVPAIDGNTEAVMIVPCYSSDILTSIPKDVNFLSEFVKRWNQKDNQKDGYDDWMKMAENNQKGVDSENFKWKSTAKLYELAEGKIGVIDVLEWMDNQALQSNAGGFSLEDWDRIEKEYNEYEKNFELTEPPNLPVKTIFEWLKENYSLTNSQLKGDIVIECEMEEDKTFPRNPEYPAKIKLDSKGQPILIFK